MRWPPAYDLFVEKLWYLPPHQAKTLWFALAHSRFSRPIKLRHYLSFLGHMRTDTDKIAEEILTPHMMMACIEDLVLERQLRRTQASHIEETMLQHVTPYGHWAEDVWDHRLHVGTLPPDVLTLATVGR
jgi:hypothetical protein